MFPKIEKICRKFESERHSISEERQLQLKDIAKRIASQIDSTGKVRLIYICTHNSRRSHFGQVWANAAAEFYGYSSSVEAFSGGTEVTALHPNSITALETMCFQTQKKTTGDNPHYEVKFGESSSTICYSKLYEDKANPQQDFLAIMTCSQADENCPYIPQALSRFATPYEDPKIFDNTKLQDEIYLERALEIGREVCFMMSCLASKKSNA